LGRAYPKDLAGATGRKLKNIKNALTTLRKAGKVEYTGEKRNQAQEVQLKRPMWDLFDPVRQADDD
jgi:predicted transcriptional regulator